MLDNKFSNCFTGNFLSHWDRIARSVKPVIAAVNGYAVIKILLIKLIMFFIFKVGWWM